MLKKLFGKFGHLLLPAIIISLVVGVNTTFAAEDTFQDFLQVWGRIISLIGSLINVILWIVIKFIGDLLTYDFIFGAGMDEMLNTIWQAVRNFVNIAFVFVLLVIAFYNIISIDPEKIPLKKSLGKVAIALILVNFSYFAAKVVLDAANILTTAVFAIPRDIITDLNLSTAENEYGDEAIHAKCAKRVNPLTDSIKDSDFAGYSDEVGSDGITYKLIPMKCYIPNLVKVELFKKGKVVDDNPSMVTADYDQMKVVLYFKDGNEEKPLEADMAAVANGTKELSEFETQYKNAELSAKKFGRNTITMILAKTMFDLNKLTEVSTASSASFFGMTISGIVNLILLLLYGVMFIAMFIVLIFRVVYLWICIAFSPLVALMFVFKDFGVEMPPEADISKLFIQYAFVPVKMGIALSVGVLMLFKANQQGMMPQTVETIGEAAADIQIPIDTLVNDTSIQKLMWNIATIAVIWIAIKWSLSDLSGPVKGIVGKITDYVEAVGGVAAKVPLTLPIAPYSNMKEGGERQMTTLGAALRSAGSSNLNRIVEDKISGTDRETSRARQDISNKLDRIGAGDQRLLTGADYTKNDEFMTNIVNDINPNNRNKLAEKLVLTGAMSAESDEYKKWAGSSKTESDFRTLLSTNMNSPQKIAAFGKDIDAMTEWSDRSGSAGAKAKTGPLLASNSPLLKDGAEMGGEWSDDPTDKSKDITASIATLPDAAQKVIEKNLKVEKDAEGKYSAEKTATVLNDAVQALKSIEGKGDKERKAIEESLKGQAQALFNAAKGSVTKTPPVVPTSPGGAPGVTK
ncbi:MAG: hypothetical protein Q8P68_06450 [Candidatus Peregrinibacteria bacterium]|nr:hypothetical protein [Candidatus Peregrinibacteria bacterium]MDZ4244434.1 hypothetical protein [Candidatus Gracilibacteria bacterium]